MQADIERLGLAVSSKVTYLGIIIGDVSPSYIYAKSIAVSFLRTQVP